jgi:hypothetical protein
MGWATDLGMPEDNSNLDREAGRPDPNRARQSAIARTRLSVTLEARRAAVPTDPTLKIIDVNKNLRRVGQLRWDLTEGRGVWANTEAGRAGRDLTEARRRAARSSWMAEHAGGWRERRSHRKEAAAWTEWELGVLGRWKVHGAPEAGRLDGLLSQGEEAVRELTRRRDCRVESLDEFHRRQTSSARTLSEFERDLDALRDHLDGIERPSAAMGQAERSFRRRGGLDYHHDHGIGPDLDLGLGR